MHASIGWGRHTLELDLGEECLVPVERAPIAPNLADPVNALREALEHPLDYPPLRLALTPDDHVAIAVDEGIPGLGQLLVPILEEIARAHVKPGAVTLICAPASINQPWLDDLPEAFEDVCVEVHQPADRKKLAYLATTRKGERIYLNRTAVNADQLILLNRRGHDPRSGYAGAELGLYPGLGDEATLQSVFAQFNSEAPGGAPWPLQSDAREIAWLLGAPFFVQIIEGAEHGIAHIVAGPLEASAAGQRLLDGRWRMTCASSAAVVIAGISGDPTRHTLDDLARAFFSAARVVRPGGCIALLTEIKPVLGPGFEAFRRYDDPMVALKLLLQERPSDLLACYHWASAADLARLYLLSGLAEEQTEELFATPMQQAEQVKRLLTPGTTCILLPDAHLALAEVR